MTNQQKRIVAVAKEIQSNWHITWKQCLQIARGELRFVDSEVDLQTNCQNAWDRPDLDYRA